MQISGQLDVFLTVHYELTIY